jgi:K+ transporter
MALAALGVVYGDIGTSPLYTFKTAIAWAGGEATPAAALGMLSLIVWTLIITTSIKYVAIVMRADNDGEGGILALMSLLGIKHGERAGVIALGILGAALLYGDGAITPAISVLSALEGIKTPLPAFAPYVLPLSIFVLSADFAGAAGSARHCGHHHRKPVHYQRHVLDDAPSHPARLVPAAAHHPDVVRRLRPDLRGVRQLGLDGADAGPGAHLSLIR